MANDPRRFGRKRIATETEAAALAFQSQGSYPSGLKTVQAYALRTTLAFADLTTASEIQLFTTAGNPVQFDTNIQTSQQVPNGQALLVQQIDLYAPAPVAGMTVKQHNAWVAFQRDAIYTFARNNAQWDAQFLGLEAIGSENQVLEGVPSVAGNQFVRVGDLVKPVSSYKLRVPVVLGENVNFTFSVRVRAGLGGANPLVAATLNQVVALRGILTKVSAT